MASFLEISVQVCLIAVLVGGIKSTPIRGQTNAMSIYRDHYDLRPYVNQPGRHNLVLGTLFGVGQVLYSENCQKRFKFLPHESCTYRYNATHSETITAILVRDNWDDNTGGNGELISGGPYEDDVVVKITSMFARGLDSDFSVYGVHLEVPLLKDKSAGRN